MLKAVGGDVLVAGVSTRALAVSAARAGYRVTAIDAFGDRDLRAVADVVLARPGPGDRFGPLEAAARGVHIPASLAAYTSNFENYPDAVERLARGRVLLGNSPEVLRRVRNPFELRRALVRHGFSVPETLSKAPVGGTSPGRWLLKPRRSGGGTGVRPWRPGEQVPRGTYLQQRIAGTPGSIIFAGSRSGSVLLGLTRQLVGKAAFGASGYRYCGSLLAGRATRLFPSEPALLERSRQLAAVLTREFQLVGLNGADFIAHRGVPYIIEVNPRFSASMELVERSSGLSMFEVHAGACRGVLPVPPPRRDVIFGKAIVFARRAVEIDSSEWPADGWIADLPHSGEQIQKGRPICTAFAEATDATGCYNLLVQRAAAVYRLTSPLLSRAS